jgi:biopolymer transport protein ExbB
MAARASGREELVLSPDGGAERVSAGAGEGAAYTGDEGAGMIVGEEESLWRLFCKGGYVMPVILIASIVALAFGIERGVALRSPVQTPKGLAEDVAGRLNRGGMGAAVALVKGKDGVLERILAAVLGRIDEGRDGMEEAAAAESYRALYDLRRNVRPIGIVASVAPLLGLLGTVLGMIKAFDTASGGGLGRGQELARGIAEALLTTGAGLVVAIPALVAYHYFRARSEDFVRCSETDAASFIDRVLASRQSDGRHDRSVRAPDPRPGPQTGRADQLPGAEGSGTGAGQTAARAADGSGGAPAQPAKGPAPGGAAGTSGSARAAPTGAAGTSGSARAAPTGAGRAKSAKSKKEE